MRIRVVTIAEFFAHPDSAQLLIEYGIECRNADMPPPNPNREMYEGLEAVGALRMLGVFADEPARLAGIAVVLVSMNPHYSVVIGVTESLFVRQDYRAFGTGMHLRHAAERLAREMGAVAFYVSAPTNSRLAAAMERSVDYRRTNAVYFRGLQ